MRPSSSVFLIGYRGSGKSSVGELLAARLACPFVDSDRLIEARTGQCISEIFAERGEESFRDLEEQALVELTERAAGGETLVVAAGGGSVLRSGNVERMRGAGTVIWLSATAATLRARIVADVRSATDRPALEGRSAEDEVEDVLAGRLELYRQSAHIVVSTEELDPGALADHLREQLESTR